MDTPLFVKNNGMLTKIMPGDVVCLEADRAYCNLYVMGRATPYTFSIGIGKVHKIFPEGMLLAVGRSHCVNVNHIKTITTDTLIMDNGLELQHISKVGMNIVRRHVKIIG